MKQARDVAPRQSGSSESVSGPAARVTRVAAEFSDALYLRGLHAALGYLNARIRYRFSALYCAEPPLLHTEGLFDRENPTLYLAGAVKRLEDTYCAITCATSTPFSTMDAQRDPRLVEHAARDSILCYMGVPVRLGSGRTWGSVCHFDLRPRLLATDELAVLAAVAPVIADWLVAQGKVDRSLA